MNAWNSAKRDIAAALPHATVKVRHDTVYTKPAPHTRPVVTVEGSTIDEYWQVACPIAHAYDLPCQHIMPTVPRAPKQPRRLSSRNVWSA